jgi:excisionase family DNA binding protein
METQKRAEPLKLVAASFNISYDTFFRAAKSGKIKTIRFGNRILVPADEIERISREGLLSSVKRGR